MDKSLKPRSPTRRSHRNKNRSESFSSTEKRNLAFHELLSTFKLRMIMTCFEPLTCTVVCTPICTAIYIHCQELVTIHTTMIKLENVFC